MLINLRSDNKPYVCPECGQVTGLIEKLVLGAIDVLMWPSTNWRQWRLDRLDRQIAAANLEGDRLEALNRAAEVEIAQLRQTLRDQGIDPDQ